MKKFMTSVGCWRNGSMYAVEGSGSSSMSDSWICWKPRIDEPSNISPSLNTLSPKLDAGKVKCCITPGRSQNRTSMNCTSFFLMYERTSSALLNMPGAASSSAGRAAVDPPARGGEAADNWQRSEPGGPPVEDGRNLRLISGFRCVSAALRRLRRCSSGAVRLGPFGRAGAALAGSGDGDADARG